MKISHITFFSFFLITMAISFGCDDKKSKAELEYEMLLEKENDLKRKELALRESRIQEDKREEMELARLARMKEAELRERRKDEDKRRRKLAIKTIENRLLQDVHNCWRSTLDVEGWTYSKVKGGFEICAYDNFNFLTAMTEGCDGCSWKMILQYDSFGDLITCQSLTKQRKMNSCD